MKKIAFTSITTNYLPKARVLGHSVKRYAPDVEFVLVLAEPLDVELLRPDDPFDDVVCVEDLEIPSFHRWLFTHSLVEACTAIKGHALVHLLDANPDAAVLYFDPDMVVTYSLDELYAELEQSSTILTPHGIEPETEMRAVIDNEISQLRYGVYNLGFLGVRNSPMGMKFARWWAQRLHDFCFDDIPRGLFTDQRWGDLAPAFFDGVKILRNPGYNVATWNLSQRTVSGSLRSGLRVNGCPLVFYHFSGFDSGAMETMLNAYGGHSPVLRRFRQWYIRECERMGQSELSGYVWRYSRYDNGEEIRSAQRQLYRQRLDLQEAFQNPFSTREPQSSYLHWYMRYGPTANAAVPIRECAYEILILALGSAGETEVALKSLLARTLNVASVRVAAAQSTCDHLARSMPFLRLTEISEAQVGQSGFDGWLLSQIEKSRTAALIFLELGLEMPELWDFRLTLGAMREQSIVTLSPLFDGHPLTALRLHTEQSGILDDEVDQIVCNLDNRHPVEAPAFLPQCFFIDTVRARKVLHQQPADGLRWKHPPTISSFARQCIVAGFSHVILNDMYVGMRPSKAAPTPPRQRADPDVELYVHRDVLSGIRRQYSASVQERALRLPTVAQRASRRQLHVSHGWGGGLARWIRSYCISDMEHPNLVLRPVGEPGRHGSELELYAGTDAATPLGRWPLAVPIKATMSASLSYRQIIHEIVRRYGIDVIFVSSLIGHGMDILTTGLPTVFVCHDYFPLTPAVYLRSRHVSGGRLRNFSVSDEFSGGPLALFPNWTPTEAAATRHAFQNLLAKRTIKLVAPSQSTRQLYLDLAPTLHPDDISVIPHGTPASLLAQERVPYSSEGRLRVVIPGRMAPEKGSILLASVLPEIAAFADVLLLGTGLEGGSLVDVPNVEVVARYDADDLGEILGAFQPHVGLLLSDFPETFSYTLDELIVLGIPPIAVRIGAFADRIRNGHTGLLVDNDRSAVVEQLMELDRDRVRLRRIRAALEAEKPRSEADMLRDYEELLLLPRFSSVAANAPLSLPTSAYARVCPEMHLNRSAWQHTSLDRSTPARSSETNQGWWSQPDPGGGTADTGRRLDPRAYQRLIREVEDSVDTHIPAGAAVAVVSRGDHQLLQMRGRLAVHFPEAPGGGYLGHHPANSTDALAHLEIAKSRGARFLVIPTTSIWWLEHYREFAQYLNANHHRLECDERACVIYSLGPRESAPPAAMGSPE